MTMLIVDTGGGNQDPAKRAARVVRQGPIDEPVNNQLVSPGAAPDPASRARVMRGQNPVRMVKPVAAGAAAAGQLVRDYRTAAGFSERTLARRAAVARSTVTRLEHGQLRPRRSLLSALAVGLDPDRPKDLLAQFAEACGDDIAPESDGWRHHRRRIMERGILRGDVPMPTELSRRIRLHQGADAAWREAMTILHRHGALDDAEALGEANRLMALSGELRDQAGGGITMYIGKVRMTFGVPYM